MTTPKTPHYILHYANSTFPHKPFLSEMATPYKPETVANISPPPSNPPNIKPPPPLETFERFDSIDSPLLCCGGGQIPLPLPRTTTTKRRVPSLQTDEKTIVFYNKDTTTTALEASDITTEWNVSEVVKNLTTSTLGKASVTKVTTKSSSCFEEEDIKILKEVKKARPTQSIMMIISRTGQMNENGFPCHKCLKIVIDNPLGCSGEGEGRGDLKDDVYFSTKTQGRCDDCLKIKTTSEWNSISWERLEWYEGTSDGKLCANEYLNIVNEEERENKISKNKKNVDGVVNLNKIFLDAISSEISSKMVEKYGEEIVKFASKEIASEISPKILNIFNF